MREESDGDEVVVALADVADSDGANQSFKL